MNLLKFTKAKERGVTMIEYALLLAVVVLGIVAAFNITGITDAITAVIEAIITKLTV